MATTTHGQDLVCVGCGEITTQHPLGRPRHYCSTACRVRAHRRKSRQDVTKNVDAGVEEVAEPDAYDPAADPTQLSLLDTPTVTE